MDTKPSITQITRLKADLQKQLDGRMERVAIVLWAIAALLSMAIGTIVFLQSSGT